MNIIPRLALDVPPDDEVGVVVDDEAFKEILVLDLPLLDVLLSLDEDFLAEPFPLDDLGDLSEDDLELFPSFVDEDLPLSLLLLSLLLGVVVEEPSPSVVSVLLELALDPPSAFLGDCFAVLSPSSFLAFPTLLLPPPAAPPLLLLLPPSSSSSSSELSSWRK